MMRGRIRKGAEIAKKYSSKDLPSVNPILQGSDILFDTSNGTVSWGNILRTQKSAMGKVTP